MKALFFHRLLVLVATVLTGTAAISAWLAFPKTKQPATARAQVKPRPADPLAKSKARSVDNLIRLVSALHQYHDRHHHFPPAAQAVAGKPLLSWRVLILPYLGEEALYKQFRLDEPWDSKHNRTLLPKMPAVFACTAAKKAPPDSTFYQAFVGPHTVLLASRTRSFGEIANGSSNVLILAEAAEAVPWTKPVDLAVTEKGPLPKLGGLFPDGYHVAFADTEVQFVPSTLPRETLRPLLHTRDLQPTSGQGVLHEALRKLGQPIYVRGRPLVAWKTDLRSRDRKRREAARAAFVNAGVWLWKKEQEKPGAKSAAALTPRQKSLANLREIALALQHYADTMGRSAQDVIPFGGGKPLLSWRVLLLPYLGEDAIYRQFRLDESWDGPNNRKLLARMPSVYAPVAGKSRPHTTYYQALTGPGTAAAADADPPSRLPPETILLVEAESAVPWTKPEDVALPAGKPLPRLGGMFTEGFHVAVASGEVFFLPRKFDSKLVGQLARVKDARELKPGALRQALVRAGQPLLYEGEPLTRWLDRLESDDPGHRHRAERILTRVGPKAKDAVGVLLKRLEATQDSSARTTLCRVLKNIRPPTRVLLPALLLHLPRQEAEVLGSQLREGLADDTLAQAIPDLLALLHGESLQRREATSLLLRAIQQQYRPDDARLRAALDWRERRLTDALWEDPVGPEAVTTVLDLIELSTSGPRPSLDLAWSRLGKIGATARPAVPYMIRSLQPVLAEPKPWARGDHEVPRGLLPALASLASHRSGFLPDVMRRLAFQTPQPEMKEALARFGPRLVPHLRELLSDPRPSQHLAVDLLPHLGPAAREVAGQVRTMLEAEKDSRQRLRLACVLALLGETKTALPVLLDAVRTGPGTERTAALAALRQLGPTAEAAIGELEKLLPDGGEADRVALATTLWRIAPSRTEVTAALEKLLGARDPDIALEAAGLLLEKDARHANARKVVLAHAGRPQAAAGLKVFGPEAKEEFDSLARILQSSDRGGNRDIARALVRIDAERAARVLAGLTKKTFIKQGDQMYPVRFDVLTVLEEMGPRGKAALPALMVLLRNESIPYSNWFGGGVAATVASMGPAAIPELRRLLEDDGPKLRLRGVVTLGKMGRAGIGAIEDLLKVVKTAEGDLRLEGIRTLGRLAAHSPAALMALRAYRTDRDPTVRTTAVLALASTSLEDLKAALKDENLLVRRAAVAGLSEHGAGAVALLRQALADPHRDVRRAAVVSLGRLGNRVAGVVTALGEASRDKKDRHVRLMATWLLGEPGGERKEVIAVLQERLRDPVKEVRELAAMVLGEQGSAAAAAVPALLASLKDGDAHLRWRILQALGSIGPRARDAIEVIQEAVWGNPLEVPTNWEAADQALERIDPELAATLGLKRAKP